MAQYYDTPSSLADMIRQASFYGAGGQDPGNDIYTHAKETGKALGDSINSAITNVLAIKKASLDSAKTSAETQKLNKENSPANEVFGTPLIKDQIATAERAPVPPADLASGVLNSRQANLDQIAGNARTLQDKFGNATVGQYKDMAEAQKALTGGTPEDFQSVSKVMTFDQVKSILPKVTPQDYAQMTVGGLKQYVASNKETNLNENRRAIRDESRDKMVLDLRKSMETNPVLNKIKEQGLGLDTTSDIANLISDGNMVAAAALGIKEAKGLGEVGVMTNQDVRRYITSGQLSRGAADKLMMWLQGTPTEATLQDVKEINNAIQYRLIEKTNEEYGQYADLLANNFDISREEAMRRLAIKVLTHEPQSLRASGGGGSQTGDVDAGTVQKIQAQLPPGAKIKSVRRVK